MINVARRKRWVGRIRGMRWLADLWAGMQSVRVGPFVGGPGMQRLEPGERRLLVGGKVVTIRRRRH